jgi:hypothetical protein
MCVLICARAPASGSSTLRSAPLLSTSPHQFSREVNVNGNNQATRQASKQFKEQAAAYHPKLAKMADDGENENRARRIATTNWSGSDGEIQQAAR